MQISELKSVSQIVFLMVAGLKKEWVNVNMRSYGMVDIDVCFGCAATNTLCEMKGASIGKVDLENSWRGRTKFFNESKAELEQFEQAIDELRRSNISGFLLYLSRAGITFVLPIALEIQPAKPLPFLGNENYKEDLHHYDKYANWLKSKGF